MSIARGTTPTFSLTFDEESLDLTTAYHVYVTFSTKGITLTKTGEDLVVAEKQIDVYLTQEETLMFATGKVEIQANWTTATGGRVASDIATYEFTRQLLDEVVE